MKIKDIDSDIWLFHLAFRQLVKQPDALLQTLGLGRIHHRILFVIGRSGEMAVGAIAEKLDISRQALHGPMRQLRDGQLIASSPSPENRTVQLVRLTNAGLALEHEISELQRQHLRMAFSQAGKGANVGWRNAMTAVSQVLPKGATA